VSVVGERVAMGAGAVEPVPVRDADCGEPAALSVTLRVAVKVVADAGLNVTEMLQVEEAASDVPQMLVWVKSAGLVPVIRMPVILSVALPAFERVMFCEEAVVPTLVVGKVRVDGESETMGAGVGVPVPLRATVWMEVAALSVTLSDAVRVAVESGVNVTAMAQDDREASVEPQVLAVMAKSVGLAPAIMKPLILSVALPGFESVMVCVAAVLTAWLPKLSAVGLKTASGTGAEMPAPVSVTLCGELAALSANESEALNDAAEDGVNVMETVQVADAARLEPQLLVAAKLEALAPVMEMDVMLSVAPPVFLRVMVWAGEVAPAVVAENDKAPTESDAMGVRMVESPGPVQPLRDPNTDRHTARTTL